MKRQANSQMNDIKPNFGDDSAQHLPPLKIQQKFSQPGNLGLKKTNSIDIGVALKKTNSMDVGVEGSRIGKLKLPDVVANQIMKSAHQKASIKNSKQGIKMSSGIRNQMSGRGSYNISSLFRSQKKVNDDKIQEKYEMDQSKPYSRPSPQMFQQNAQVTDQIKNRIQNRNIKKDRKASKKMNFRVQSRIKNLYDQKMEVCNICSLELPEKQFQGVSTKCSHLYCASCLQQYIIYKINSFEEVQCPNESCRNILQEDTQAYAEIPLDLRKKFKKIRQYQISKQQGKRLCPRQECDGVINLPQDQTTNPTCRLCTKSFCRKCFFQVHQGACDPYQLNFLQNNLHYRQCNRCKNVIQKSSGCNHMTCKCGYQFCYVCGKRWTASHVCNNPDGQPVNVQTWQCCCFQCDYCECCDCLCERCCQPLIQCGCCRPCQWCCEGDCAGSFCDCIGDCFDTICNCNCACCPENCCQSGACRFFKAIPLFLLWLLLLVPLTLVSIIGIVIIFSAISIVVGSFGYPFILLLDEQTETWMLILGIIFFPITMLIGIGLAFRDLFCEQGGQCIKDIFTTLSGVITDICQ